ncbi:MAG: hypothetical protein ABIC91_04705 [Nanoarchaeota archaeon]|nr:hypothetical protein [Nanoarchaeota archaeon]MBU1030675.1 hypothetical protein [Nanoarchaeota archaeon]MBU1849334.1 hypothetical protein [Nanoarchaeota archaeon]
MGEKKVSITLISIIIIVIASSIILPEIKADYLSGCPAVTISNLDFPCGQYDGVCPEKFFIGEYEPLTCSVFIDGYKCLDPDCMGCVVGNVKTEDESFPEDITSTEIVYQLDVWNGETFIGLKNKTTLDVEGNFTLDVPSGTTVIFTARNYGYGSDVNIISILEPFIVTNACYKLKFVLPNASCEGDCTLTSDNLCHAPCHEKGQPNDMCEFYSIDTNNEFGISTADVCYENLAKPGTRVLINRDEETQKCTWVNCCEGGAPYEELCPKVDISKMNIMDAIRTTRIVKYNNQFAKIHVYYWE